MKRLHLKSGKLILLILIGVATHTHAQETVFGLFRSEASLGDEYYENKNYKGALKLYLGAVKKHPSRTENQLRVARCYYSLKEYKQSIFYYDNYIKQKRTLPWSDLYNYAEAQAATSNYTQAIESYRKYLAKDPNDEIVKKKIWRLNNIQYLYEDSSQYEVKPVSLNTTAGEICPAYYQQGIVFMSNRKDVQIVEKINASLDVPFYKILKSNTLGHDENNMPVNFGDAQPFDIAFTSDFNAGPVTFYDDYKKMVFVATGDKMNVDGTRTLQLHFAERNEKGWKVTGAFPYNNVQYSISDPSISKDGTTLYFSSDMSGGLGGRDIYRSTFENGKWTRPQNLGAQINTSKDEVFPYIHLDQTLYFSSNGHPGMGELDIFKAALTPTGFLEPENVGYPINSSHDDFGIIIDDQERHGYFSSNRKNGGFDDDIYAVEMDLQSYPLTISGVIKYKEITWGDSLDLKIMANTKISIIDNVRNIVVHESTSDSKGNFAITIPYFSKYIIRVTSEAGEQNMSVLEIPKRRRELSAYELVIVKEVFRQNEMQEK